MVNKYGAVKIIESNNKFVIISKSTKKKKYQISYFYNNEVMSDSQINNFNDLFDYISTEKLDYAIPER